jgi:hypothetical protein
MKIFMVKESSFFKVENILKEDGINLKYRETQKLYIIMEIFIMDKYYN